MRDLHEGVQTQVRYHWHHGQWAQTNTEVVEEVPLTLFLNGAEYVTVALTPMDLNDWVVGFLAGEGLIQSAGDISVYLPRLEDGQLWVRVPQLQALPQRGRYLGSCCGQSRPGFFDPGDMPPLDTPVLVDVSALHTSFRTLSEWSHSQHSGGLHVAGLADGGQVRLARADVGRHNALDKLYGAALRDDPRPLTSDVILFSGRLSAEIIWKVRLMGCPIIVSNAAPTTLGLQLAHTLGITAIGFLRDTELSVYTHGERLGLA